MTHAEFELYRPTYTLQIKALLITPTEAIEKANFISHKYMFSGHQCVWMSQTNVDETVERGQLWIRRVFGRENKSMWDEEKTVLAPERRSPVSLLPCVDKSKENK